MQQHDVPNPDRRSTHLALSRPRPLTHLVRLRNPPHKVAQHAWESARLRRSERDLVLQLTVCGKHLCGDGGGVLVRPSQAVQRAPTLEHQSLDDSFSGVRTLGGDSGPDVHGTGFNVRGQRGSAWASGPAALCGGRISGFRRTTHEMGMAGKRIRVCLDPGARVGPGGLRSRAGRLVGASKWRLLLRHHHRRTFCRKSGQHARVYDRPQSPIRIDILRDSGGLVRMGAFRGPRPSASLGRRRGVRLGRRCRGTGRLVLRPRSRSSRASRLLFDPLAGDGDSLCLRPTGGGTYHGAMDRSGSHFNRHFHFLFRQASVCSTDLPGNLPGRELNRSSLLPLPMTVSLFVTVIADPQSRDHPANFGSGRPLTPSP